VPTSFFIDTTTTTKQTGFYLQDQLKFGERWAATIGLRRDKSDQNARDNLAATDTPTVQSKTTGRVGMVYLASGGLAPYVSYASSFLPVSGTDANSRPFAPETGRQYELGVKFEPEAGGYSMTGALYELQRQNVLTPDPRNTVFSVQNGEQRHRGLELELRGTVTRSLNLVASYSYIDPKITRANDGSQGKNPVNVTKQQASVWAVQDLGAYGLPGLAVGLGVRHVGNRYIDAANTLVLPSFTALDGGLFYRTGPWRFALNMRNLTDKNFVLLCVGVNQCEYGEKRSALLTGSYAF
jgi:iron complex outermembrane receptor protein